jgi:hypothetical protein
MPGATMSHSAIQLRAMRAMLETNWSQTVFTVDELTALIWMHATTLLTP